MSTNLVTVFGGSGFLGRHTVWALARAGWRIKVATRHPSSGFFLRPLGTVGHRSCKIDCDHLMHRYARHFDDQTSRFIAGGCCGACL